MHFHQLLITLLFPLLITTHALPGAGPPAKNPAPVPSPDTDDGNTGCLSWCKSNFHSPTPDCVVPAKGHHGPCFDCGPQQPKQRKHKERDSESGDDSDSQKKMMLCKEKCCDSNSDNGNCGRCGQQCSGGQVCQKGTCQCPGQQTLCADKTCKKTCPSPCPSPRVMCGGPGGTCCPSGQVCGSDGKTCTAPCVAPRVMCGATCCPSGQICGSDGKTCGCATGQGLCSTPGVCTPLGTEANCNGCGNACTGGQTCVNGACTCAMMGYGLCGSGSSAVCTDLTSNTNCKTCGTVCTGGETCVNGACACPGNEVLCGSPPTCADLSTTPNYKMCGSPPTCTDVTTNSNCGDCSIVCNSGATLSSQSCRPGPQTGGYPYTCQNSCPVQTPHLCPDGQSCRTQLSDCPTT